MTTIIIELPNGASFDMTSAVDDFFAGIMLAMGWNDQQELTRREVVALVALMPTKSTFQQKVRLRLNSWLETGAVIPVKVS